MSNRVMELEKAASLVVDGDQVGISGNMNLSPMALIREIIKKGTQSLGLLFTSSAAINADMLLGAGVAEHVEFPQIAFGEYGLAPHFRKKVEEGDINYLDHT